MWLHSDAKALFFLPEFLGSPLDTLEKSVQCNITATLPRLWDTKKEVWCFILLSQLMWKFYKLHYYHIHTIPSALSRRDGYTILIKNVSAPTNPMAAGTAQAQEDLIPPHFALWNTSWPSGNSVEMHFTELLLFYLSFALITSLFFSPWKLLFQHCNFFCIELNKIR